MLPRKHSGEKQKEIRKQVDVLLDLGVIKESQATKWSQIHLVPKPTPEGRPQKWRFTLDFVRLNSATGGLEGWPIPNIQQIINRIGTSRKVLGRDREKKVTANPAKTRLDLKEVEYVGHLISSTGTSFTEEKRLQVLDFPLPETEKALLQFIGLANYFRGHVPNMT